MTSSALRRLLAITAVAAIAAGVPSRGVRGDTVPDVIDGTGLLNYRDHPRFQVGSWVRYHTTGTSLQGHVTDYTTTILIAGEEVCWGDPAVWVETWLDNAGGVSATASLVSYSAFGDTMAYRHLGWFLRKSIAGIGDNGEPEVALALRQNPDLRRRKVVWDEQDRGVVIDTLGADTVMIPLGTFKTTRVVHTHTTGQSTEEEDSTSTYQRIERLTYHLNREIPITGLVRLDIDDLQRGKTWAAGRFTRDSLHVLERAQGASVLVAQGTGGLTPRMVPASVRHPIADRSLVERAMKQPLEPTVRVLPMGSE